MSIFEYFKVFANFAEISKIPRESGSEKAVSDFIADWARGLSLDVTQDEIGNLIIKKPATAGYEDRDALILQAHLDMVCEKRAGSEHDFSKDPICLEVNGDWLSAKDTTLGADNGIGVALAMSILEAEDIKHPPLEAVFTVCEETDFSGAAAVDMSLLKASRMINLDHACEREVLVGSCGGVGVEFNMPIKRIADIPSGLRAYRVSLGGLVGGHSGEDIHRGRANAILLMLRLLEATELPLVSIEGGTSRLAIPREASAVVLTDDRQALKNALRKSEAVFREEYPTELGLGISAEETDSLLPPLDGDSLQRLRLVLRTYPNGIVRMFDSMTGVVESSDNVGIVETKSDCISMVSEIRGAYTSTTADILETIKVIANSVGAEVETFAAYSPWTSKNKSPLRELAISTYENMYGRSMTPIAVHAGLECGFFAAANPELDIISLGADCENFHSPEERVSISSVLRLYDFLTELLSKL
ncbi:MAG: beta-Ala-His dipeptidase [Mogibacterium sp.]|nr:beta-Ala-His dipeptidase [Mogibacterium sp.]